MLTRGTYQWDIDYETLQEMKKATEQQEFLSDTFKIGELDWKIKIYPNGHRESYPGSFRVDVALLSIPTKWHYIIPCINIHCHQTLSSYTLKGKFTSGHWVGWKKYNEIE